MRSEYIDEVAEKRCGDSGKVHRGDLQPSGGQQEECFEGVDSFNYLGWVLHLTDDDWAEVLRNILRARKFWGLIGKLLRR